ncbi:MAG: hypothetical protein WDO56_34490 [Gammaproteobacteria bacterium]
MKIPTFVTLACLAALAPASVVLAQAPPAQQSVPLPPPATLPSQTAPSTEALAWAQKSLAGWPEATRRLGAQLMTKYGAPAEVTSRQVTWIWQRAVGPHHALQGRSATQLCGTPHKNVLEQAVFYKVPVDKLVAAGAVQPQPRAEPGARRARSSSDSEELNFLAINVAEDVVKGERTPEEARDLLLRSWCGPR